VSITLYLGDEVKEYKRKFKEVQKYLKKSSLSETFIFLLEKVYLQVSEKKNNGGDIVE